MGYLLGGVLLLVIGLLYFYRPSLEWLIKFNNKLQGDKTEITNTTIIWARIPAVIFILLGLFLMLAGFGDLSR